MTISKNQVYDLPILSVTNEGCGVAKLDGYTVFVPRTAAGDFCRVQLVKCNKSYGYGRMTELLSPSPDRIEPDCSCFVQCGGCTYRHISYEAELKIKAANVKDAFERLGGIHALHTPIIGSNLRDGYRNKAQFPIGTDSSGKLMSGFYAARSHRIVGDGSCLLQPSIFTDIHADILRFLQENSLPAYDEKSGQGLLRHIYLRRGEETGEIMVCLVSKSRRIPKIEKLVSKLTVRYPDIKSIIINVNPKPTNVILGAECHTVYGKDSISDILCGIKVKLSPLSFYQVNKQQAEILYRKALEYADLDETSRLLDLYCGAGTIGLAAAKNIRELIGVEVVPEAIADAKENAAQNNITNARFLCADAGEAAQRLAEEGTVPDTIIVDPPRKGLDQNVIDAIVKMSPNRLVMVSCNPSSAARDCAALQDKGYEVREVTPIDLFPRTNHVETVILMTRCGDKTKSEG